MRDSKARLVHTCPCGQRMHAFCGHQQLVTMCTRQVMKNPSTTSRSLSCKALEPNAYLLAHEPPLSVGPGDGDLCPTKH